MNFLEYLERASGQPISRCYQCKKCSGGCPVSAYSEVKAHQVIRLAQQGERTRLISAPITWYCIGCKTCQARCPNSIDISAVIDVLKAELLQSNDTLEDIAAFHQSFLNSVKRHGRVYELGMVAGYKWRVKKWTEDMQLGQKMFTKGKLKLLPHRIKQRRQVRQLFDLEQKGGGNDG